MEENPHEPAVKQLIGFINPQAANRESYLVWTHQPLAKNFKQHDAWSIDIVPYLFSNNLVTRQKAQTNCQILLHEIIRCKESIQKKQAKDSQHKCWDICAPISLLAIQILCASYGPIQTLVTANVIHGCTKNLEALYDISQAYVRHGQELDHIKEEISKVISISNDNNNHANFIIQLIQKHEEKKQFHSNLIDRLQQKPLSAKKND